MSSTVSSQADGAKSDRGPTCVVCKNEPGERRGILNLDLDGKLTKSFNYWIGLECYRKQFKEVWPKEKCLI